jgi:hypothetical protein
MNFEAKYHISREFQSGRRRQEPPQQLFNFLKSVLPAAVLGVAVSSTGYAKPVEHTRTESSVDWTSAGVAGTGNPGTGTITVAGVAGSTVTAAFLYWHGIGNPAYNNAEVQINGNPVTGSNIGDSSTNCWGAGSSSAFRADVTAHVAGDGAYFISEMSTGASGNSSNGASLVVIYDDGNPDNNRDLAFFEGNDSDTAGFPGETNGWHASLSPINYGGGVVGIQFHGADGQNAGDGPVQFDTSTVAPLVIPDDATLWDGISVPSEGAGRGSHGLWDIHTFDLTSAFPAAAQSVTLDIDGQDSGGDCLALIVALVDLEPGSAPPPDQALNLTPKEATNCTNEDHTVTATVLDDEDQPVVATNVSFEILSGPNIGVTFSTDTDVNGQAEYTFSSASGGTDVIEACFFDPEQAEHCDTARKTWEVCNEPPVCEEATPTRACLWPPNHDYHNIGIDGVTDPDGDQVTITFNGATSDEATATEKGAGGMQHSPDVIIDGIALPEQAGVRSERSGKYDGRVYELHFTADDGNTGQCSGTVSVQVPHNVKKSGCDAIDSGQDFDATATN